MSPTFLDNIYSYSFSWDSSRHKKYSSLVAAYGITSVGKVC
jgi:hypothetical protein